MILFFINFIHFHKVLEEQYKKHFSKIKSFYLSPRIDKKTTLLRSVDNTYYYDDDLSDINNPKYTNLLANNACNISESNNLNIDCQNCQEKKNNPSHIITA